LTFKKPCDNGPICLFYTMFNKDDILSILKNNSEILRRDYHVQKIGLFGSCARNEQRSGSDVDILVEFDFSIENIFEVKSKLRKYLSEQFGCEVDLCRIKYLKPYAREIVLREAIYAV